MTYFVDMAGLSNYKPAISTEEREKREAKRIPVCNVDRELEDLRFEVMHDFSRTSCQTDLTFQIVWMWDVMKKVPAGETIKSQLKLSGYCDTP